MLEHTSFRLKPWRGHDSKLSDELSVVFTFSKGGIPQQGRVTRDSDENNL